MLVSPAPALVLPTGRQYPLSLTAITLIGSRGCAIIVSDPGVAAQHVRIIPSAGQFLVQDLGGGTKVNGAPVSGSVALKPGDSITVGVTSLTFYDPRAVVPSPAVPSPPAPPSPVPSASPSGPLPAVAAAAAARGERTLWEGRPRFVLSPIGALITRYKLTTERLQADTGLLRRALEEVELIRVKDIRLERGVLQRLFGSGTIEVITIDSTAPVLKLHDVAEPERLREAIRNAVADERQKRGRMMIVP